MTRDKFIQKTLKEDNKYLTGYVAFLDILGFKELYKNRTIFNCHKSNIKFIESKIIATYGVEYEFYDIESEARLTFEHNHNHDFNSLKKDLVNDIKKARKEKNNG